MNRYRGLGLLVSLATVGTLVSFSKTEVKAASEVSIEAAAHVQNIGDQRYVYDGQTIGTEGRALRIEGLSLALVNPTHGMYVQYRVHIQNIGWTNWMSSSQYAGTKGQALRIEAVQVRLVGAPSGYHVQYQAHVQDIGWQGWVKDGATAGTTGQSKRVEAIRLKVVNDNEAARTDIGVKYQASVQNIGTQSQMANGEMVGTVGENLRLERINMSLSNHINGANISYRVHLENRGWLPWVSGGVNTGAIGNDKRIEAIEIKGTGLPQGYHVEYNAHVQDIGWQGWVRDGSMAGTTGKAKRIEGLKVRVVKDNSAPAITNQPQSQNQAQGQGTTQVQENGTIYTHYNITLNDMVNKQMQYEPAYQMKNSNNQWEWRYAQIQNGKKGYFVINNGARTFHEDEGTYNTIRTHLTDSINPALSRDNAVNKYQFLKLSYVEGTTAQQLNASLRGDGVLAGKGQVFIDAAREFNINPIYLAAHCILETGNGTSRLAKGMSINGRTVYNLFGIGAVDKDPENAGALYAYNHGWTSVDIAIKEGARFVSSSYINSRYKQDTIYKMRWNPANPGVHEYATDVRWALNQVAYIKKCFDQIPNAKRVFDIPVYK